MKLSATEKKEFIHYITELLQNEQIHKMKKYIQHGNTTTYTHCLVIAYYSYWLSLRIPLHFDTKSLTRGAMLHDFYLYDWHMPNQAHKLHGFYHAGIALHNAKKHYDINPTEADIISSHMWPLTLTRCPRTRESVIVCLMDKICSLAETFHISMLPKDYTFIEGKLLPNDYA
ncbi:phosphohydrolase [Mobilitalea sibirica]|uniref:Phosphohydrolase n=1 Tax=Mobilitalea sibirica TaxID=1462919 RepID=A0A8J7KZ69_9FIRM|nr:phosphohydrolase [Mobilitalea sibirica]MBH1939513.1 phosphohydrolase [Mobilitalea sibirica]